MHDGGDTPTRRLRGLFDELDGASITLSAALEELRSATAAFRRQLDDGMPLTEIYSATAIGSVRDRVSEALVRVNENLRATRAEYVRAVVDGEGLTITDVARRAGRSRQFITRLLEDGRRNAAADNASHRSVGASS